MELLAAIHAVRKRWSATPGNHHRHRDSTTSERHHRWIFLEEKRLEKRSQKTRRMSRRLAALECCQRPPPVTWGMGQRPRKDTPERKRGCTGACGHGPVQVQNEPAQLSGLRSP